ncbi:MAG: S9 family peptidase [Pirellulaceae bacterium]|nr:S9 family peptidase [Pirellulaceae bacterium]
MHRFSRFIQALGVALAVPLSCAATSVLVAQAQSTGRMTGEKLFDLGRIGDAAVSPDGSQVAYLVTYYNLADDSSTVTLYLQSLVTQPSGVTSKGLGTSLASSRPQVLLEGVKGLGSLSWIARPEGARLLYIAPGADENSKPQAWMLDPAAPDTARQITHVQQGIANLKASPKGDHIAFSVNIKLDATVNELYPDLPKADARIIDSLMYRHWNAWHDYTYSHVHVARLSEDGTAGEAIDLMPNMRNHCPLPPHGGADQFAFSPDGQQLALTLKLVDNPAESTDSGIYLVPAGGGELRLVTPDMPGYDMQPRYSADGRYLIFHSMQRGGFEADRNRIFLIELSSGQQRELTQGLDQDAHETVWADDASWVYFSSEQQGTKQIYRLGADGQGLKQLSQGWFDFSVVATVPDSPWLLLKQQNMLRPVELALLNTQDGQLWTITDVNGEVFAGLELPTVQQQHFRATDGQSIQCWVVVPPDFDPTTAGRWPMLTYCQGGPQSQIGQWFSYRWNFHLMAAKGYVVLAVNRRGLPGFGRRWNDQISGDWGGQAMQDILSATDGMIAQPSIDAQRVAAIGASFGGYTAYWLMGNSGDRFCAMVSHCGVFNLESMYGATEELFFVNWDMGGPYWLSPTVQDRYSRFSPHRYVGNWKTPLLVIHGEKDFRVPVTQGIEAFTAAQVQGVPSRFLYFPEEGHWVIKPQNSVLWGRVFFDWLATYCKPGPVD